MDEFLRKLPIINSEMKGLKRDSFLMPDNILIFVRYNADKLIPKKTLFNQHHRYVLLFNFQTPGCVNIDQTSFLLKPGQAVLIWPFQFHSYSEIQKNKIKWLYITFDLPVERSAFLEPLHHRILSFEDPEKEIIKILLQKFTSDLHKGEKSNQVAIFTTAILELLRQKALRTSSRSLLGNQKIHSNLLNRVQNWTYLHMRDGCHLKMMARDLGISESFLRAKFKRETKMSLGSFVRTIRFTKACGMMDETTLNVSQIAEACGFQSLFSFSRAFKAELGCSPRQFRKNRTSEKGRS
jgi:AraC-like DNA-binding protein